MKITFIGAAHEVTGSCTLLEVCGRRIMVDCGLEQGPDIYENCEIPVPPEKIDAILLTHAHIDHSGKLPVMTARGFAGKIYTTQATGRLANIMLRDSASIQESEAEWRNRKAKRSGEKPYTPLYTTADVEKTMRQLSLHPYGETVEILEGVSIRFLDAGHLFGSASILISMNEEGVSRTILFSGDIGNPGKPLLRDPQKPPRADYVVLESTYGDRLHERKKVDYVNQLAGAIQSTLDRGGNLVIPAFAVGRTQELLYLIRIIKERNLVHGHADFPVYLDSPLAIETTNIYSEDLAGFFDDEALYLLEQNINPVSFPGLYRAVTSDESKAINNDKTPKVIISASGMCEAGRIRHHLKHNLWRPESTILFVGYQSEGTVGRKLLNGAKTVRLFGEDIAVHAKIETMASFSSHADRDGLINWVRNAQPHMIFVNHGEDEVCETFARSLEIELSCPCAAPFSSDEYDLATGVCAYRAEPVKKEKTSKKRKVSSIYRELAAAGERLMALIGQCSDRTEKELKKFLSELEDLYNRYKHDR